MTIPAWPAALPQVLQRKGFKEAPPDLVLASQPDIGPAKLRRKASSGPRPVQGYIYLETSDLVDVLLDFYNEDLIGGTLRFSWRHPRKPGVTEEYRFVSRPEPEADQESAGFWVVLDLEMLP